MLIYYASVDADVIPVDWIDEIFLFIIWIFHLQMRPFRPSPAVYMVRHFHKQIKFIYTIDYKSMHSKLLMKIYYHSHLFVCEFFLPFYMYNEIQWAKIFNMTERTFQLLFSHSFLVPKKQLLIQWMSDTTFFSYFLFSQIQFFFIHNGID